MKLIAFEWLIFFQNKEKTVKKRKKADGSALRGKNAGLSHLLLVAIKGMRNLHKQKNGTPALVLHFVRQQPAGEKG